MLVRRETEEDHRAVAAVHRAGFGATVGRVAGGGEVAEARLVDDLRRAGAVPAALSLVAVVDGVVVGHVVCSRAAIDGHPSLGLGPLGVLPDRQRRGVGSALVHAVLAAADALDEPTVVLLGDPAYYRRFGFRPAAALGIAPERPEWSAHLQVRTLATWQPAMRGTFRYAEAFHRL